MHSVTVRRGGVTTTVVLITVVFCLLGSVASGWLGYIEPFLVLGLMLVLGLPHGATDHGLFLALPQVQWKVKWNNFYLVYVLVLGAYGLLWLLMPLVAFGLFLLLSVYHFGQSNWADIQYPNVWLSRIHFVLWGAGILFTPILLHFGEAADIVAAMTGFLVEPLSAAAVNQSIIWFSAINLSLILALAATGFLTKRRCAKEIMGYGLLMALFFTNSLLLGFTVYFVFWHSLGSIRDQLHFFQNRLPDASRKQLFVEIGVVVFGALAFCLIVWFGPGPEAALQPAIIGRVFILISILTLPHMILVEQLYQTWSDRPERVGGLTTNLKQKESKPQSLGVVPVDHH